MTAVTLPVSPVAAGDADVSGGRSHLVAEAELADHLGGQGGGGGQVVGATVLTDAKGLTLYSFAPDTPSMSNCNGTCAGYWPPVTGTPAAGRA